MECACRAICANLRQILCLKAARAKQCWPHAYFAKLKICSKFRFVRTPVFTNGKAGNDTEKCETREHFSFSLAVATDWASALTWMWLVRKTMFCDFYSWWLGARRRRTSRESPCVEWIEVFDPVCRSVAVDCRLALYFHLAGCVWRSKLVLKNLCFA